MVVLPRRERRRRHGRGPRPKHRSRRATESDPAAVRHPDLDQDQTYRYAEASGDNMPIHLDAEIAKSVGLPGIIIHGLCTMAFTSWAAIARVLRRRSRKLLKRLAVRFSRPVLPGQTITTTFWAAGEPTATACSVSRPATATVTSSSRTGSPRSRPDRPAAAVRRRASGGPASRRIDAATLGELSAARGNGYGAEFAAVLAVGAGVGRTVTSRTTVTRPARDGDEVAVLPPVSGGLPRTVPGGYRSFEAPSPARSGTRRRAS